MTSVWCQIFRLLDSFHFRIYVFCSRFTWISADHTIWLLPESEFLKVQTGKTLWTSIISHLCPVRKTHRFFYNRQGGGPDIGYLPWKLLSWFLFPPVLQTVWQRGEQRYSSDLTHLTHQTSQWWLSNPLYWLHFDFVLCFHQTHLQHVPRGLSCSVGVFHLSLL